MTFKSTTSSFVDTLAFNRVTSSFVDALAFKCATPFFCSCTYFQAPPLSSIGPPLSKKLDGI